MCVDKVTIVNSVGQYLHYLSKYHEYRFNTSVEEISIYRDASFDTTQFAIASLYCWQILHTAWQQRKSTSHSSFFKHIVNIYF